MTHINHLNHLEHGLAYMINFFVQKNVIIQRQIGQKLLALFVNVICDIHHKNQYTIHMDQMIIGFVTKNVKKHIQM